MENLAVVKSDLNYIYETCREELSYLAGHNVLLTGGAGFLGYYLVQTLLFWNQQQSKKINLTIYDNLLHGMPAWLDGLAAGFDFHDNDISLGLPKNAKEFNYIIHAASIASPSFYRQYPLRTIEANVFGLRHLLNYCLEIKSALRGILFFSSSEIYGEPEAHAIPTPEDYPGRVSCTGPRACYDEAKRFGETLCVTYTQEYQLPIKIVRPFNNYGPGLAINDRRVIADIARDILKERDVTLYSDGTPTRTFCYVADAIIGYLKVLVKGNSGEAYNIGVEQPEISIKELAELMRVQAQQLFYYQGKIIFENPAEKNYLTDNPQRRCPNIQKARQQLGYEPYIDLATGIQKTLTWYQTNAE